MSSRRVVLVSIITVLVLIQLAVVFMWVSFYLLQMCTYNVHVHIHVYACMCTHCVHVYVIHITICKCMNEKQQDNTVQHKIELMYNILLFTMYNYRSGPECCDTMHQLMWSRDWTRTVSIILCFLFLLIN